MTLSSNEIQKRRDAAVTYFASELAALGERVEVKESLTWNGEKQPELYVEDIHVRVYREKELGAKHDWARHYGGRGVICLTAETAYSNSCRMQELKSGGFGKKHVQRLMELLKEHRREQTQQAHEFETRDRIDAVVIGIRELYKPHNWHRVHVNAGSRMAFPVKLELELTEREASDLAPMLEKLFHDS